MNGIFSRREPIDRRPNVRCGLLGSCYRDDCVATLNCWLELKGAQIAERQRAVDLAVELAERELMIATFDV